MKTFHIIFFLISEISEIFTVYIEFLAIVENNITSLYPRKAGILCIMHGHHPRMHPCLRPQRFSCVQPTSHISFWISLKRCKWLAMAEIWPPYCFGSPGVKICCGESKMSKILTIVCVQAVGHSFFQIYFMFSA